MTRASLDDMQPSAGRSDLSGALRGAEFNHAHSLKATRQLYGLIAAATVYHNDFARGSKRIQ